MLPPVPAWVAGPQILSCLSLDPGQIFLSTQGRRPSLIPKMQSEKNGNYNKILTIRKGALLQMGTVFTSFINPRIWVFTHGEPFAEGYLRRPGRKDLFPKEVIRDRKAGNETVGKGVGE